MNHPQEGHLCGQARLIAFSYHCLPDFYFDQHGSVGAPAVHLWARPVEEQLCSTIFACT